MAFMSRVTKRMIAGTIVAALIVALIWLLRPSGDLAEFDAFVVDDGRELDDSQVRVTFLGTTTFVVDDGSTQLLFDAFLSPAPAFDSLTGLRTDEAFVDGVLDRVGADRVTDIFVSHSHHDHSLDAGYLTAATGAVLRGTESTLNIGRGAGTPEDQLVLAEAGDTIELGAFAVTVIESRHSPCQLPGHDTAIADPLPQPANFHRYKEGGSLDFLVEHGDLTMLFKASANYIPGALDGIDADALFIGTATLSRQTPEFKDAFADEVIRRVEPTVVVPTHWNNFTAPLTDELPLNRRLFDNAPASLRELRHRTDEVGAEFVILDGFDRIILGGSAQAVDGP